MTHDSVLGCFESLWHYGLPTSPHSASSSPLQCHRGAQLFTDILNGCSAVSMNASQPSWLQLLFAVLDEDGDGKLSLQEMCSLLAKLGMNIHSDNLLSLIRSAVPSVNQHQPTSLDFPQFAQLYAFLFGTASQDFPTQNPAHQDDHDSDDDDLLHAFQVYDTNRDGFISAAELAAVLLDLGLLPATAHSRDHHRAIDAHLGTCQAYIQSVDLDGNGMVDLQEFKALMTHNNPPTSQHTSSSLSQSASVRPGLPLTCKT